MIAQVTCYICGLADLAGVGGGGGQIAPVSRWASFGYRHGKLNLLALFVIALAIRVVVIVLVQPQFGIDSAGYIADGRAILTSGPGALSTLRIEHAPLYGLFLAAGLAIPVLDIAWFAALSQAMLGAATVVIVARMTARETHSAIAGLSAGAIAAVQLSFVFWTAYVLSDTLFLFVVAVCADRVLALRKSTNIARDGLLAGLLVMLVVAARPTGIVFAAALLPLVVMTAARRLERDRAMLVGSFGLPILLVVAVGVLGESATGATLRAAPNSLPRWAGSAFEIGLLWTESGRATAGVDLGVSPPPVIETLPPDQRAEFLDVGPPTFATRHPEFVVAQDARKLRMFFTPVLPEYSRAHAVVSSVYFLPFYVLAGVGFVQARRLKWLVTLICLSVVLFTLTSLITIVDYDQRYRLPVELFLVPVAGIGLAWVLERAAIGWAKRRLSVEPSRTQPVRR